MHNVSITPSHELGGLKHRLQWRLQPILAA